MIRTVQCNTNISANNFLTPRDEDQDLFPKSSPADPDTAEPHERARRGGLMKKGSAKNMGGIIKRDSDNKMIIDSPPPVAGRNLRMKFTKGASAKDLNSGSQSVVQSKPDYSKRPTLAKKGSLLGMFEGMTEETEHEPLTEEAAEIETCD